MSLAGRWSERSRLDDFVEGLAVGPRALEITGEAGIGKSALLGYGIERGRQAGYAVLVTRSREEEMGGARVGLWDLFEHTDLLPALVDDARDHFERGRCLLAWLREREVRTPVLIAIDDLQWLDVESGRALRYALRRLVDEPVGLLTTLRTGGPRHDGRSTAEFTGTLCEALDLGPIDMTTMRAVLTSTLRAISRPMLRRIHQASGGNPLYAIELARGLARTAGTADSGLRLPASLQAAIERRLGALPAELREILDVVAAHGPTFVDDLVDLVGPVGLLDRLATAESIGVLVTDEDLRVRFAHPLLASVSYGRMSPLKRRSVHARLAGRVRDHQQHARHLALSTSEPDEAVAAILEEAAERARASGACDLAAQFAQHSVRLTPASAAAAAHRRALAEVRDLAAAGETSRALARLDAVLPHLPAGIVRADALVQRFYVETDDYASGDATLVQALAESGADTALRGRVLDLLGWLRGMFVGTCRPASNAPVRRSNSPHRHLMMSC